VIKKQKPRKHRYLLTAVYTLALLLVVFIFYFIFGPRPSGRYLQSILNKIGAPDGFTVSSNRQDDDFLSRGYSRRTYDGVGDPTKVKLEMVERFKKAGFKNVRLAAPIGTEGVYADCKGASVFARIYQKDDKPIDIEVFATNYPNTPRCPWLL
jgi:hypothetical protein